MRKSGPRKQMIRQEVLDHAAALFSEKGAAGTSIQDIAEAVGLSRSALYYYFGDKEAVLTALVEEVTEAAFNTVDRARQNAELKPAEKARAAVHDMVVWVLTRRVQFRALDRSEAQLPAKVARQHLAGKRRVLEAFTSIIEEGQKTGEFHPVDPKIAAFALIGMCNWSAWWFSPEGESSIDEVATTLADQAVRSLLRDARHRPAKADLDSAIALLKEDVGFLEQIARHRRG